jgi:hypothetical protein
MREQGGAPTSTCPPYRVWTGRGVHKQGRWHVPPTVHKPSGGWGHAIGRATNVGEGTGTANRSPGMGAPLLCPHACVKGHVSAEVSTPRATHELGTHEYDPTCHLHNPALPACMHHAHAPPFGCHTHPVHVNHPAHPTFGCHLDRTCLARKGGVRGSHMQVGSAGSCRWHPPPVHAPWKQGGVPKLGGGGASALST